MNFPHGQSVTWLQRSTGPVDADGNNTFTWTPVAVAGAAFNPGPSIETVQGMDMVVDSPTLYLPPTVSPSAYDRFQVGAETYEVAGSPNQYKSPFTGWNPGTVVALKGVSG